MSIPRGRKSLPYLDDSLTIEMVVASLRPYTATFSALEMFDLAARCEMMTPCSPVWADVALDLACQMEAKHLALNPS